MATQHRNFRISASAALLTAFMIAGTAEARPQPTEIFVCPHNPQYERWYFDPPVGPSYSFYYRVSMSLQQSLALGQTRAITEITAGDFLRRCPSRITGALNPQEVRSLVARPPRNLHGLAGALREQAVRGQPESREEVRPHRPR